MNKTNQKRTNRGDEKHLNFASVTKSKSKDRKSQQPLFSNEIFKKSTTKTTNRNDENLQHEKPLINKKTDDHQKKSKSKDRMIIENNKPLTQMNFGDGNSIKENGKIHKYIFHDDDSFILKLLNYSLDINEGLLTLYDPRKPSNKRSYFILSSKEICYDHIKEHEAFQLKVKKIDKDLVSDLILKAKSNNEKYCWLEEFGIKMHLTSDLLKSCIEEVENRRFCKGQKKRNETKELKDVDIGTLLRALEGLSSHKLKLSNNKRWNVSRIEKLIQVLLNETPQPLIPYQLQEILDKSTSKNLQRDYAKILKRLPVDSNKMLQMLIEHLENLTNYYANQLNANPSETERIRKNICARLTPLIIRKDFNRDQDPNNSPGNSSDDNGIIGKFCTMFYKLMESSDLKRITY